MTRIFGRLLFKCRAMQATPSFSRDIHGSNVRKLKVGDAVPSALLFEGSPGNAIDIAEFCKEKLIVIFGVPGAFTPSCSRTHLPGYIDRYYELKRKGIDDIVCVSVNDVFVMDAWGRFQDATGKIRMFADPDASFTKLLGVDVNLPKLGGTRSKRYSMVALNGVITVFNVEPDSFGLSCSLAANLNL